MYYWRRILSTAFRANYPVPATALKKRSKKCVIKKLSDTPDTSTERWELSASPLIKIRKPPGRIAVILTDFLALKFFWQFVNSRNGGRYGCARLAAERAGERFWAGPQGGADVASHCTAALFAPCRQQLQQLQARVNNTTTSLYRNNVFASGF